MSVVRMVLQTNHEAHLPVLQALTSHMRGQAGCIQAEDHRGVEFEENLLHLERWESPAAWDAAWAGVRDSELGRSLAQVLTDGEPPHHNGLAESPRRHGQNGLEFYRFSRFSAENSIWEANDPAERAQSIRAAVWNKIRIVIQMTVDPAADIAPRLVSSANTRAELGCEHFEFMRSLEHPENMVLIELWTDAETYDIHWLDRVRQRRGPPPSAMPSPIKRAYGDVGFEFYNEARYVLSRGVFQPEPPEWRSSMLVV
jgi:quinol monooxygenase YgiN